MSNETIAQLRKRAQTQPTTLSDEDRLRLYGPGNPNVTRYALRGNQIVSRLFRPGDQIPDGWVDTPTKLGAPETHPSRAPDGFSSEETVVGTLDGSPASPEPPKYVPTPEDLAAAARVPTSGVYSGEQHDFGDEDDGAAGPQG